MAKQAGVIQLQGSLGTMTFYRTEHGFSVRRKSSLTKERVLADPAFGNSRRAAAEFGRAGRAAKLLRDAFRLTGGTVTERYFVQRLTAVFMRLLATDTVHLKGERLVGHCDLGGLSGFEWNKGVPLHSLLRRVPEFGLDTAAGTVEALLPALQPASDIIAPAGATHFRIMLGGAAVDFETGLYEQGTSDTGWRSLGSDHAPQRLGGRFSDFRGRWLLAGAGIVFGIETNGKVDELLDKHFRAFAMA